MLKQERERIKKRLGEQLKDMTLTVKAQEKKVMKSRVNVMEDSTRDKAQEMYDAAVRRHNQQKKAESIVKFESVLVPMCSRALKQATITAIDAIKEPLFEKAFAAYFETSLSSSSSIEEPEGNSPKTN